MPEIKLKPCPFCGGKAFFANRFALGRRCRTVVCEDCSAVITNFQGEDKEGAAALWNMRMPEFGQWIDTREKCGSYICSKCEYQSVAKYKYCPDCGKKMKQEC